MRGIFWTLLTLFCCLQLTTATFAQNGHRVKGKIADEASGKSLPGANVVLVSVKDTTNRAFAVADIDGNFEINGLDNAFYKMTVTFVGYQPMKKFVRVNQPMVNVGTLSLKVDTEVLKEVTIQGNTVTAVQKGDTLQYNATAYKTNPDANAEDLITKMPGIIVDQSGVQAQGEQVQKVLVDGQEFFANDPAVALKTIPAEIISKIEVFDQLSDQAQFSGFDDGQTTKTLNIITKPTARNGQFGRVYAGYGTEGFYSAGGNVNDFNDKRRLTVVGLSNNINQQNFADEDIAGIAATSGNRRRGRRGRGGNRGGFNAGGNASDFLTGSQAGISQTHSVGLNYSNQWEKLTLNGSYFFNARDNSNDQLVNRETFLSEDVSQFYTEESQSTTLNYNHRLNLRLQWNIDRYNSIIFTPGISFQQNDQGDQVLGRTAVNGEPLGSVTSNDFAASLSGFRQNGSLLYRHRFAKRGRTFSVRLRNNTNSTENDSEFMTVVETMRSAMRDTTDQFAEITSDNETWSTNISYTEPVWQRMQLQFSYDYSVNNATSERSTFDQSVEEPVLIVDNDLSNEFDSRYMTSRPGVGMIWRKDKVMVRAGLGYQQARLESSQLFPEANEVNQDFNNLLPNAMIRWNFTKEKNLRIMYRTRTENPSVSQLQNVIDNSNPLLLSTGNPALGQSVSHSIISRYSNTNVKKSTSFFSFILLRNNADAISNSTFVAAQDSTLGSAIVLPAGGQLSRPVNIDGNWNIRSFSSMGLPLGFLKSNINLNLGINYQRTPSIINEQENVVNTLGTTTGFVVGSNISEKVDFTLSYSANYTVVENNLQPDFNDNFLFQTSRVKFNWILRKGLVFRSDLTYQQYSGLEQDFEQDFLLWNISIGKKIMKNQQGEIRVDVFDLLEQNNNVTRTTAESYVEDAINQVVRQYFMLSFTYNIRNFKSATAQRGS